MTHVTCRLPRTRISSGTLHSIIEYRLPLPFYSHTASLRPQRTCTVYIHVLSESAWKPGQLQLTAISNDICSELTQFPSTNNSQDSSPKDSNCDHITAANWVLLLAGCLSFCLSWFSSLNQLLLSPLNHINCIQVAFRAKISKKRCCNECSA